MFTKIDELRDELRMVGKVANQLDLQISTHPSQYYVLNSHRQDVVDKAIESLDYFAKAD